MNDLQNLIYDEKYRPSTFNTLIFQEKEDLLKYLNQKAIPSFIFYSASPGCGKTTTARLIIDYLQCDSLQLNSSKERGIDVIREQITTFAMSLSGNHLKRCVFLDEADGMTFSAQDSLRNLMELYSDNCFFIFSCNNLNKIIAPIQSRCKIYSFDTPTKNDILSHLLNIVNQEKLNISEENLISMVEYYYPDIRSMVKTLQDIQISGKPWSKKQLNFEAFLEAIINHNIDYIISSVYSAEFDMMAWNKWFFKYLFDNHKNYGLEKCSKIAMYLADTEKVSQQPVCLEVIFLANVLKIMETI